MVGIGLGDDPGEWRVRGEGECIAGGVAGWGGHDAGVCAAVAATTCMGGVEGIDSGAGGMVGMA